MKRATISFLCLMLLAVGVVAAQDDDKQVLQLHLKSGEALEGRLLKADEDGVKLDIGDGIELFVRWSYTRGDKHYELRKDATDFGNLTSVLRLADFCHDFAMDEQEVFVLAAALKLDPGNVEVRSRLEALPKVDGVEIPNEDGEVSTPDNGDTPDNGETPDDPLPPPTRNTFKVFIDMKSDDETAETWLEEQFTDMKYKIGTEADHEIRLEVDIKLTLTANPDFMGAELYAQYDGELTWKVFRQGDSSAFDSGAHQAKEVRRDTRDEARTRTRKDLLEEAFPKLYSAIEKQR